MEADVIGRVKEQIGWDGIRKLGQMWGENESSVQAAMSAALPAVLGGLVQKVSSPSGATVVSSLVADKSMPNDIGASVSDASAVNELVHKGKPLIETILGSQCSDITDMVAKYGGVKSKTADSLLGLSAPLMLSTIRNELGSVGLSTQRLSEFVNRQTSHVRSSMPPGAVSVLGALGLDAAIKTAYMDQGPDKPTSWRTYMPLVAILLLGALFYGITYLVDKMHDREDRQQQ